MEKRVEKVEKRVERSREESREVRKVEARKVGTRRLRISLMEASIVRSYLPLEVILTRIQP